MTTVRLGARATALHFSLLASLGLLPVACGGTYRDRNESEGGGGTDSGGKATSGGSTAKGGSTSKGGSPNVGGSFGTAGTNVGGGGRVDPMCSSPVLDPVTGLVTCGEGYTHRPKPQACSVPATAPAGDAPARPAPVRADGSVVCNEDPNVCSTYQYGYCDYADGQVPTCQSGCVIDQDCGAGSICICDHSESPTGGACRPSQCASDLDCGDGYCASYWQICGRGGFACQSAADECSTNAECAGGTCSYDSALGHRACNNAVCGRPFLVESETRVAPVVASRAWTSGALSRPRLDHLSEGERAELAAHWTRMGQMEHASIAAFARFSLQLLSLGAPPELVEACTSALADETAHTKLCFELAGAYAGHAVGPGPLDVTRSLEPSSLEDIVDLVIAEGCLGETSAALEAIEAADGAADPVIRAAYARIAADEQRHAELAFKFVRWALTQAPERVRGRIIGALQAAPESQRAARSVALPILAELLDSCARTPHAGDAGALA